MVLQSQARGALERRRLQRIREEAVADGDNMLLDDKELVAKLLDDKELVACQR